MKCHRETNCEKKKKTISLKPQRLKRIALQPQAVLKLKKQQQQRHKSIAKFNINKHPLETHF